MYTYRIHTWSYILSGAARAARRVRRPWPRGCVSSSCCRDMTHEKAAMALLLAALTLMTGAQADDADRYLGMSRADLDFWDRAGSGRTCDHAEDCCHHDRSCANEAACTARGCCWDPHGRANWCSGTPHVCDSDDQCGGHGRCNTEHMCECDAGFEGVSCGDTAVEVVHVVQSCHLDVGFDGTITMVLNEYFTKYIPSAIATAKQMRADASLPTAWRSNFMLQAYYVSLYLDCPQNLGLACPNATAVSEFKIAAAQGDIHWHAFPHNAELEMGNPTLLEAGINLTHSIDASLGLPPKRVLSQRDVPGVSRAAIPVLKRAGVRAISVGVNTASMYPRVPKIFRWQDEQSGEEVFAMWHSRGYGGYTVSEAVRVKGLSHVLVTDWNGDNQGPSTAATIKERLQKIQDEFPNATVVVSTFDNFTSLLEVVDIKENIPIIKQEIADTWIYGTPSDPVKQSTMRAMMRAWAAYDLAGGAHDPVFLNASRFLVKSIEHTWGDHVELGKFQLADSWENQHFQKDRDSTRFKGCRPVCATSGKQGFAC
jgi:hypothetical protein